MNYRPMSASGDMERDGRVCVFGGSGMVGSAIMRELKENDFDTIFRPTHAGCDLFSQHGTFGYISELKPEYVFVAAARAGGIEANLKNQAGFLNENIQMAINAIEASNHFGVKKLLFLGSSCVYPKHAPQPIKEYALLTGPLEPTNEGYAIAKIAGVKMCEYINRQYGKPFISAMPCNLYGPGDNFHPTDSHVIPGMMRRFHEAKALNKKAVTIWGSGTPLREFLHVDDLAEALMILMHDYSDPMHINVGSGGEISIRDLAYLMREVTGFKGDIEFDLSKPDGTPRKLLDSTRMRNLGWAPKRALTDGLHATYRWALDNKRF